MIFKPQNYLVWNQNCFFCCFGRIFFGCASLSKIFLSRRASELFFFLSKSVTRLLTSNIFLHSISLTYSWVTVEERVVEFEQTAASCSFVPLEVYLWTVGDTHTHKHTHTPVTCHTLIGISQVSVCESGTADGRQSCSQTLVIWSHTWLTDSLPMSFSVEIWAVSQWPHEHKSGSRFITISACTVSKSMWTLLRTVPFAKGRKNSLPIIFLPPPSLFLHLPLLTEDWGSLLLNMRWMFCVADIHSSRPF